MKLVNRAEFARMLGVNRSTVTRWVKDGRILLTQDGMIDPEVARRQVQATESPEPHHTARREQLSADRLARGAAPTNSETIGASSGAEADPGKERAHAMAGSIEKISAALKLETYNLQKAKAEEKALQVDRLARTLVDRAEIEYILEEFGTSLRVLTDAIPDRYASQLAALGGDVNAIHSRLEEAVREIQKEMEDLMERKCIDDFGSGQNERFENEGA